MNASPGPHAELLAHWRDLRAVCAGHPAMLNTQATDGELWRLLDGFDAALRAQIAETEREQMERSDAERQLAEARAKPCPYVTGTEDGTLSCSLPCSHEVEEQERG